MKKLLLGLIAPLMVLSPASAEVQPGTFDLIDTVDDYMTVNIDSDHCDTNKWMSGSFAPATRTITLCPRGEVTADDHDTVRHEVWHVIQWCLTPDNERYLRTVIEPGTSDWNHHIMSSLTPRLVSMIKENYPYYAWNAEFEAYASAKNLTATQIKQLFIKACVR